MKMFTTFIVLLVLTVAQCQEYEFMDNLVDFEHVPYQHISLPYPYQDSRDMRLVNIQSKPQDNVFRIDNDFKVIELPAKLKDTKEAKRTQEVKTSLSTIDTSLKNNVCSGISKIYGFVKKALTFLVLNIPALTLGAVVVVVVCKITSICSKINSIKSINEVEREFNTFVTPERLNMATEFVQEAIRTYRSIQAD